MYATFFTLVACLSDPDVSALPVLPELPPKRPSAVVERGPERELRELVVAFTGSVRGEVEVCGCPTTPYGGFARRAALLDRVAATGVPLFVVDAGEMLVKGLTARDELDRSVRAQSVLDLAAATRLDAWAAAPTDLLPGGLGLLARHGALAANWRTSGADALAPSRVVERGGVRIGLVGLAADSPDVPSLAAVEAVKSAMAEPADAWFVLSNAGPDVNREVAAQVPGLAAILATEGDRTDDPVVGAGAPIVETPGRGRYVTLVHTWLATDARPLELVERGIWRDVAATRYGREVEALPEEVRAEEVRRDRARLARLTAGRAVAYVERVPLAEDLDGASALDPVLARFRDDLLQAARAGSAPSSAPRYATGAACAACHGDRLASWGFDGHARALEALARRGATGDPECVGCHTTGFGQPGGFAAVDVAAIGAFRDVQCEACHGPMSGHDGRGAVRSRPVTEATCRTCHDEANSPAFDYASYLAKISCSRMAAPEDAAPGAEPRRE